jgi:hypothetical protein
LSLRVTINSTFSPSKALEGPVISKKSSALILTEFIEKIKIANINTRTIF